jgi:ATP-dependent helicase/nuclease subunit A
VTGPSPAAASDPAANQRRATDPAASVWVAASAGTGKTQVLTERILALLLEGAAPERILALTFTKAAAAEMSKRIAERLGPWATMADAKLEQDIAALLGRPADAAEKNRARTLFARVLDAPGGMPIQTIHAFCQSLLRRFPLEAGIAPHFALMDERDAGEMLAEAREEVLARAQSAQDGGALRAALAQVTRHVNEDAFAELMAELARARGRLERMFRRFGAGSDSGAGAVEALRRALGLRPGDTPASIVAGACADGAFDALGLKFAAGELRASTKKTDGERGEGLARWLESDPAARIDSFRDYANLFLTFSEEMPKVRARLVTKDVAAEAAGIEAILDGEAARLLAAEHRRRAAATADATAGLLALAEALIGAYAERKRARALLDYDDLIHAAERLLAAEGNASWVLYKLDGGIDHILIDEGQDTNPEQWRVVAQLAAEFFAGLGRHEALGLSPRTVFAVGDVKQSIFGFQGADPDAFLAMRDQFAAKARAAARAFRTVDLNVSFRSVAAVLDAVDAVFARPEAASGVNLDGAPIRHEAFRAGQAGLVELWPPVEPRPSDEPPPWKPPVERTRGDSPEARLAGLIARRIARMVREREMLPARGRPIRPGDVMVLVRRRTAFVDALVRALKELGIPVAGVDRLVLTEHLAVMDLVALGRFALHPEDDLTLATVLKGPLAGLSEDDLFVLAHEREGSLWRALNAQAEGNPAFARARDALGDLLARADFVPPFEFYADVLSARRGREKLLARLGPDADDPLTVFLDLALAFEDAHPPSLEGFLHWLERGEIEVKRELEHGVPDAVRVITVHGAKGLQAPVVFLPDTMQVPARGPKFFWTRAADGARAGEPAPEVLLWPPRRAFAEEVAETERARAAARDGNEFRRLLYVAMTRAEDRLYVCGWRGKNAAPEGNWYELIREGLQGIATEIEEPFLKEKENAETAGATVLRLAAPQAKGAKRESEAKAAGRAPEPLPDWARTAAAPEPVPPRPLAPSRPQGEEPGPTSPLGADEGLRFRRGTLLHRLLQHLPNLAAERRGAAARRWLERMAGDLDSEIRERLAAEAIGLIADPAFAHLFGPNSRAEVPVAGAVGDTAVAGQVDRLAVAPDSVFVLDYKTHRRPPANESQVPELYLRQMALYRALLAGAFPGRRVRCALLWTEGPRIMELSDAALDRFAPVEYPAARG